MKLTIENDRETLKRYGHIRPARGLGVRRCGVRCTGSSRTCTLETGHRGNHVAHGAFGKVVAVWDDTAGTGVVASTDRLRTTLSSGAGRSLRVRDREGAVLALWHRVTDVVGSVEELAWVVLFVVFLAGVFHWLSLLFGVSH